MQNFPEMMELARQSDGQTCNQTLGDLLARKGTNGDEDTAGERDVYQSSLGSGPDDIPFMYFGKAADASRGRQLASVV